jgi:hypothetical protein
MTRYWGFSDDSRNFSLQRSERYILSGWINKGDNMVNFSEFRIQEGWEEDVRPPRWQDN